MCMSMRLRGEKQPIWRLTLIVELYTSNTTTVRQNAPNITFSLCKTNRRLEGPPGRWQFCFQCGVSFFWLFGESPLNTIFSVRLY